MMQKVTRLGAASAVMLTALVGLTACDAPEPLEATADPQVASVAGTPSLLECPAGPGGSARGLVLPLGGGVSLDGNSVLVPLGALPGATEIGIEVPATEAVRVELTAGGQDHWQFLAPLTITIDYSRCSTGALAGKSLSVWLIDSESGELLQNMGGIDNRLLRQITFLTDHFSGYAIAN